MGTSKSYGGPGDRPPLLPDWAYSPPDGTPPNPEVEKGEEEGGSPDLDNATNGPDSDDDSADESSAEADGAPAGAGQSPMIQRNPWRSAKLLLGRAAGGGGDRQAFKRAAQGYVKAHGGSRHAAHVARSGRSATAGLGGFLADVANRGLNAALDALKLSAYIGKDAKTVFAAIANALAPDGASPEQAVAREAVDDVLSDLYVRFVAEDGDLSRLNALVPEDVRGAIVDSVTSYIYHRWLQELGRQIEMKAVSSAEAFRLEREVKLFVRDSVTVDFRDHDPLRLDWQVEGHQLCERIYAEAYSLLGAE